MATIQQAALWLQAGKKVRFSDWDESLSCYEENDGIKIVYSGDGTYTFLVITSKLILEDKWELVNE